MDKRDNEDYKNKVISYVDKCFSTAIIGALASVEDAVDKEEFPEIRKRLLDIGNDNRRNAIRLLQKSGIFKSQYSIIFERGQE